MRLRTWPTVVGGLACLLLLILVSSEVIRRKARETPRDTGAPGRKSLFLATADIPLPVLERADDSTDFGVHPAERAGASLSLPRLIVIHAPFRTDGQQVWSTAVIRKRLGRGTL